MTKPIFLIDFDGTINLSDLALYTVERFASDKWQYYEKLFNDGKLSLEDTITTQYSFIHAPKNVILEEIDKVIQIRENFTLFVNLCKKLNIPIIIVSGGIDFVIRHVLNKIGIPNTLQIVSMITEYQSDGSVKVTRPIRHFEDSIDFKQDKVKFYKERDMLVNYIGDGSSDYGAVMNADLNFTVKDSVLSRFCEEKSLPKYDFVDFSEIIDYIKNNAFTN